YFSADVDTTEHWHAQIQQDQMGAQLFREAQRFAAGVSNRGLMSQRPQYQRERVRVVAMVVHDQNAPSFGCFGASRTHAGERRSDRRSLDGRQIHSEFGAAIRAFTVRSDAAAMHLDDALCERETDT